MPGALGHGFEHRWQIERPQQAQRQRPQADQRLDLALAFVEEARVFDGDRGVLGQRGHKAHVRLGERIGARIREIEHPDCPVVAHERHTQLRPHARRPRQVLGIGIHIGKDDRLPRAQDLPCDALTHAPAVPAFELAPLRVEPGDHHVMLRVDQQGAASQCRVDGRHGRRQHVIRDRLHIERGRHAPRDDLDRGQFDHTLLQAGIGPAVAQRIVQG